MSLSAGGRPMIGSDDAWSFVSAGWIALGDVCLLPAVFSGCGCLFPEAGVCGWPWHAAGWLVEFGGWIRDATGSPSPCGFRSCDAAGEPVGWARLSPGSRINRRLPTTAHSLIFTKGE